MYEAVTGYVNGNLADQLDCRCGHVHYVLTILGIPYSATLAIFVAVMDLVPLVVRYARCHRSSNCIAV